MHFVAHVPPQSTSVSVPFFTVSVHAAALHFFVTLSQTPVAQSAPTAHVLLSAHFVAHVPPQSTSVSVPFLTVSLHAAALHFFVVLSQTPLAQSVAAAHVLLSVHFEHVPPQSTSVSAPFLIVSLQLMGRHFFVVLSQRPVAQSPATVQALPSPQGEQLPPQSASVSVPFFTVSVQLGAAQTFALQTPLEQSPAPAQALP
jgi:hypothetical protein